MVGELLVFWDGGEYRQHQTAEHQQETETQIHTQVSVNTLQYTENTEIKTHLALKVENKCTK